MYYDYHISLLEDNPKRDAMNTVNQDKVEPLRWMSTYCSVGDSWNDTWALATMLKNPDDHH